MTVTAWVGLLGALLLARWAVGALRHRAGGSAAGRRFFRHPTAAWGIGILVFFAAIALAAPIVAPYDPRWQIDVVHLKNHAPSGTFLLGTDVYSRDVWSRVVYGARISLAVGTLGMLVAVTLGSLVGAVAGY